MTSNVADIRANRNENIEHAVRTLGRSPARRKVFEAIYAGKANEKTVLQIMDATGLKRVRVLQEGRKLSDNEIVQPGKENGVTSYSKVRFYQQHKTTILRFVDAPSRLNELPTKQRPKSSLNAKSISVTYRRTDARIEQVTMDDINSFKLAHDVDSTEYLPSTISEKRFKSGIQSIIGQTGEFTDWGGERSDLFSTRLRVGRTRVPTAIAFKGPAMRGKLTPGKLGKNGDQIQRLFSCPAQLFLIQYWGAIDDSVLQQMETHAIARSVILRSLVQFGIIDGQDSNRIYIAYQKHF